MDLASLNPAKCIIEQIAERNKYIGQGSMMHIGVNTCNFQSIECRDVPVLKVGVDN